MNGAGAIVEVRGLSRVFDVSAPLISRLFAHEPRRTLTAVDGLDFTIRRGETFGLVGESGSGKSTLARMVAGLLEPSGGHVVIDGVDLARTGDRAARRRMQMIFQDPFASLNPRWRVGAIIAERIRAFRTQDVGAGLASAQSRPGSTNCLNWSAFIPRTRASFRMSFPAASASASRSRGRSPRTWTSSSATSRPRRSTSRSTRRS